MRSLAFAIFLTLASAAGAQGADVVAAEAAQARLLAAAEQLAAASRRADRVAALTETVRAYEDGLVAMREGLRRAAIREQTLVAELDARSAEVGQLLGALQSMGRAPAPLLLLHPSGPLGTARSGMIAADVTPALQAQVDELRLRLAEVAALREVRQTGTETLVSGLRGAQEARVALGLAISERTELPRRFADDPVQTALLVAGAGTLADFAQSLSDVYLDEASAPPRLVATGDLPLPVQGRVLRAFNEADAAGVVRPGLVIATRPQALVSTPVAGTLLFQGPLLEYGTVVILEPSADVLFVLAGLTEVFATTGELVDAGAPLGLMGGTPPLPDGNLTESAQAVGGAASQTLYLEVREGQTPIDPARWFALD